MAAPSTRCGFILQHICAQSLLRNGLHPARQRMPLFIIRSSSHRLLSSGRHMLSRPMSKNSANMTGKLRPLRPPPPNVATPLPILNHAPLHDSYARTLASKPSPTLLYLGPTSNTYLIACYGLSAFCISYGSWNFFDVCLTPHPGLWVVIPIFMGGVCLTMIALGGYVAFSASRLLKTVTAVPVKGVGAGHGSDLILRFEPRRLLNLFPSKVIECSPKDLRLAKRISLVKDTDLTIRGPQAQAQARRDMEAQIDKEKAYEMAHLWSAPFRHFARAVKRAIDTFSRIVSREGFVKIYIKGKAWRVDAKTGWMLDEGQALNRLLKLR